MAPFDIHPLTRRDTLQIGSVALTGHRFPPSQPRPWPDGPTGRLGRARFCIFVMLEGGQSHVDSWDFKEGRWTPPRFDVRNIAGIGQWPMGLYPELARRRHRFALVRSMSTADSEHRRGQYRLQTGHRFDPALSTELPAVGSVVAHEYASRRKESDRLPPFVSFNTLPRDGLKGSGFLSGKYGPVHVNTASGTSGRAPHHQIGSEQTGLRKLLRRFGSQPSTEASPERMTDRNENCELVSGPLWAGVFMASDAERSRYGANPVGDSFVLARNLVVSDAGTHFIFLTLEGWDDHGAIYTPDGFQRRSHELDTALSQMLDDLVMAKRDDGSSVLDETLVVCIGEFGRTPGGLTSIAGRDHYPHAFTALFAGGGVLPDQVIGATDEAGAEITDFGWAGNRPVYPEDVVATIYSAMGIDCTKAIQDTPSGRTYRYVEPLSRPGKQSDRVVRELFG